MSLMISFSVILCPKNAGCRRRTKYCQIVYKNQLIDNCNAGHLLGSQLSYHNVIQKTDEICYGILQNHWQRKIKIPFVKCSIANIFFLKSC